MTTKKPRVHPIVKEISQKLRDNEEIKDKLDDELQALRQKHIELGAEVKVGQHVRTGFHGGAIGRVTKLRPDRWNSNSAYVATVALLKKDGTEGARTVDITYQFPVKFGGRQNLPEYRDHRNKPEIVEVKK